MGCGGRFLTDLSGDCLKSTKSSFRVSWPSIECGCLPHGVVLVASLTDIHDLDHVTVAIVIA